MLILTPEVANQVRGLTVKGHALAPRLLTDGNFALPEAVLDDPEHAIHADFLRANTTIASNDSIVYETDPELAAPYLFSQDWPEGKIIVVP